MDDKDDILVKSMKQEICTMATEKEILENKISDIKSELKKKQEKLSLMMDKEKERDKELEMLSLEKMRVEGETSSLVTRCLEQQTRIHHLKIKEIEKGARYEQRLTTFKEHMERALIRKNKFEELYKNLPQVQELDRLAKQEKELRLQIDENEAIAKKRKLDFKNFKEKQQSELNAAVVKMVQEIVKYRNELTKFNEGEKKKKELQGKLGELENLQLSVINNLKDKLSTELQNKKSSIATSYIKPKALEPSPAIFPKSDFKFAKPSLPIRNKKIIKTAKSCEANSGVATQNVSQDTGIEASKVTTIAEQTSPNPIENTVEKSKALFEIISENRKRDNEIKKEPEMTSEPKKMCLSDEVLVLQLNEPVTNDNLTKMSEISTGFDEKSKEEPVISIEKGDVLEIGKNVSEVTEKVINPTMDFENDPNISPTVGNRSPLSLDSMSPPKDWDDAQTDENLACENGKENNAKEDDSTDKEENFVGFFAPAKKAKSFFSLF